MTRYGFKAVINTPREFVYVSAPPDSYRAFGRLKFSWMESAKRIAALGQYQRHLCRVREAPMWKMMRMYSKCQMQCRYRLAWLPMTNRWFLFGFWLCLELWQRAELENCLQKRDAIIMLVLISDWALGIGHFYRDIQWQDYRLYLMVTWANTRTLSALVVQKPDFPLGT